MKFQNGVILEESVLSPRTGGSAEHWMVGQLMGPKGRTWQWLRVGLWDPGTAPSCCITVIGGGEQGEFSTVLGASVSSPVHGR